MEGCNNIILAHVKQIMFKRFFKLICSLTCTTDGFDQMKCYGFATPAVFREKVSSSPSPKANSRSNSSKQKKPKRGKTPAGAVTKTAEREEPLLASALRDTAQELTTSIVLGSDLVPRLSYASATRILNGYVISVYCRF